MPGLEAVILKNGAEEVKSFVLVTMLSLQRLMREKPIALYELVQLCMNNKHDLFGNAGEILEELGLVKNGVVHDSIRNIVLSAVEGDGCNMRLTNPLAT